MKALGLVETNGLLAAIEASDVMLKTAEVTLIQKEAIGGGIVTVMVSGDVSAVKTAVDAAAIAVQRLDDGLFITKHVIARPDESLNLLDVITEKSELLKEEPIDQVDNVTKNSVESLVNHETIKKEPIKIKEVSNHPSKIVDEEITNSFTTMKAVDLRKLAKKQVEFSMNKKEIQQANKEQLIAALTGHFKENKTNSK